MEAEKSKEGTEKIENRINDEDMWRRIADAYVADTNTRGPGITNEIKVIREAMAPFDNGSDESKGRYIINDFLGVGGAGIVFKLWDRSLSTFRALKIARPIEGKEDLVASLMTEEISLLQEVSHPNIISIFDTGLLKSNVGDLPFYTMTYLRNAQHSKKYFSQGRTQAQFLNFLSGLFNGIAHLHSANLLHLDLKPKNIFVGDDGLAVIADLGGARRLKGNPEDDLIITCTSNYAHPLLLALTSVSTAGDDNRRKGTVKRKLLKFEFDRFALGKTIFEILHEFEKVNPSHLTRYQRKYLLLMASRLLDGITIPQERPLGLTEESLKRLKYEDTKQVLVDFEKLVGRINLLSDIPELSHTNDSLIQVTKNRFTSLTPRLANLLKEPLLRRLGSVSQLGLIRLVYPGASHSRLEHSLGAYSNAIEYIRSLYNDPINPLFKQIMSENDLIATLLAALLHDIGQYQFAHDLFDVEPTVFKHESLTNTLLRGRWFHFDPLTKTLINQINEKWGIKADRIIEILEVDPNILTADIKNRILHTIVSGPLDIDKLDYLIRDSDQCQTVFGNGLDRSRLLSTLTIVYQRQGGGDAQYFALGIHEKGRAAAESIGFIRFQMFRAVYWHHTVRAAKAMLQRAAFEWMSKGEYRVPIHEVKKEELYNFLMKYKPSDKITVKGQGSLFGSEPDIPQIGFVMRPEWAILNTEDVAFLQWLHKGTTETGQRLIESIIRRELFKRVYVVSFMQDEHMWSRVLNETTRYGKLCEKSEELRRNLKARIDDLLKESRRKSQKYFVTGIGENQGAIENAARVLGMEGSVLIDLPAKRKGETLLFYPEDLHRGQREEFESPALLVVSELWKLVSEKLHETAGNIRVFVHPEIDVLRSAKTDINAVPILNTQLIDEEMRKCFSLT